MRRVKVPRSLIAGLVVSVAALALLCDSSAVATANPQPVSEPTTAFQAPVRFIAGCLLMTALACPYPPPLTTVTPTVWPGAPGEVSFATEPPIGAYYSCFDIAVNWRNLTTGAAGTTVLRPVAPDRSRPVPPEAWCRYAPATAATGSGAVVATAVIGVPVSGYLIWINPGMGFFHVA